MCFMFFCVDRRNVVTGLTYSITGIRQMTIKNIAVPQSCAAGDLNRVQIGCVVSCVDSAID